MRAYAVAPAMPCSLPACEVVRARAPLPDGQPFPYDFAGIRIHARDGAQSDVAARRGAPAGKCKEFPGGSTDCVIDAATGTPTGRVTSRVDETNACTKPCVEKHEAVHVRQLQTLCAAIRDCYAESDKGKRPATDCFRMAVGGSAKNECEAYTVSVPCMAERLKNASECKSAANQRYGAEKLKSEQCWRDHYCGAAT